jgi:hypothetical protein
VLAVAGLVAGGTLLPFTLFAYGQARVRAEVAGAFLNLEPLVGAIAGVVVFGDPAGPEQVTGAVAILAGLSLSSLPLLGGRRRPGPAGSGRPAEAPGGEAGSRRGPGHQDDLVPGRERLDGRGAGARQDLGQRLDRQRLDRQRARRVRQPVRPAHCRVEDARHDRDRQVAGAGDRAR